MKKKSTGKLSRRDFIKTSGAAFVAASVARPALGMESETSEIVSVRIYPSIGIARIGDSEENDGYFIGPEVTCPEPAQPDFMRDAGGAIKRQAARFRIYGFNAQGQVVREITARDGEIKWSAHLANKKAQWYRFIAAMDIPESKTLVSPRRNPKVSDRSSLVIDAGLQSVSGVNQNSVVLGNGRFMSTRVILGELRTDEDGRLVVLGGKGNSQSPTGTVVYNMQDADSFNNADGWFDDTSDGPVRAEVILAGKTFTAESAWVVVAPPNYAPDTVGWRTMHDLMVDVFITQGWLPLPSQTSFTKDVYPILQRLTGLQWVNGRFAEYFGVFSQYDFNSPELIARLADPKGDTLLRQTILDSFRWQGNSSKAALIVNTDDQDAMRLWPMMYGDAYGMDITNAKDRNLMLDGVRLLHLQRWAAGQFLGDWTGPGTAIHRLEDLPLSEQPDMLSEAALHFCLADAFHPGCEMTWPMRHASTYRPPGKDGLLFRINGGPATATTRDLAYDLGESLTQNLILTAGSRAFGPLLPGDLTKWMALPWQGDTAYCRSGYEHEFDPFIDTFWPARVPNQVLTAADYATLMDQTKTVDERKKAFQNRQVWTRDLSRQPLVAMAQMIGQFSAMGILEARPGPAATDLPGMTEIVFVEKAGHIAVALTALPRRPHTVTAGAAGEQIQLFPETDFATPLSANVKNHLQQIWQVLHAKYPQRTEEIQKAVLKYANGQLDLDKLDQAGWADLESAIEFRLIKVHKRK